MADGRRFAIAAPIPLWADYDGMMHRRLAKASSDAKPDAAVAGVGGDLRRWCTSGCIADRRMSSLDTLFGHDPSRARVIGESLCFGMGRVYRARMSAVGHKRKWRAGFRMSASHPRAGITPETRLGSSQGDPRFGDQNVLGQVLETQAIRGHESR